MIIFTIQNEGLTPEEFQVFLLKTTGIPKIELDKFKPGYYLKMSQHYFNNVYNTLNLDEIFTTYEYFLEVNKNISSSVFAETNEKMFEQHKITIFVDKVLA